MFLTFGICAIDLLAMFCFFREVLTALLVSLYSPSMHNFSGPIYLVMAVLLAVLLLPVWAYLFSTSSGKEGETPGRMT